MADRGELQHVLSADQFLDPSAVDPLMDLAAGFKSGQIDGRGLLDGKQVATMFYEPSTRTRLSFEAAAHNLGAQVLSTENARAFSSVAKGESLRDTVRTIQNYADALILRYHEIGGAQEAAAVADVPIINAGDGAGEHPTQALLDLFTIRERVPEVDGITVGFVGDLRYGRTVHSLAKLLSGLHEVKTVAVAPDELQLQDEYAPDGLVRATNLGEVIGDLDVIYVTRIQKERLEDPDPQAYERLKEGFVLDAALLADARDTATIMHPLPRVDEIAADVDADPRAYYFEQAKNGLYVRMAILNTLLGPNPAHTK